MVKTEFEVFLEKEIEKGKGVYFPSHRWFFAACIHQTPALWRPTSESAGRVLLPGDRPQL